MKKFFLNLAVVFSAGLSAVVPRISGADEVNQWPSLATDEEMVQFMLWNMNYVPDFLVGMREYEVDYFKTLEAQHKINTQLAKQPELAPLLATRPDRMQISIEVSEPQDLAFSQAAEVDVNAVNKYKKVLQEMLNSASHEHQTFEWLKEQIDSTKKISVDLRINKLINDLIKTLPESDQKELWKLRPEEKIKGLETKLTDDYLKKLKPSDARLIGITKAAEFAGRVNEIKARDRKFDALFALMTLAVTKAQSENRDLKGPLAIQPDKLGLSQLAILGDTQSTFDRLEKILNQSDAKMGKEMLEETRGIFKNAVVAPTKSEGHTLVEMPTNISWASSCVGNECSTKRMAAYVNLPTLRRFFVDYSPQEARGFIEVQLVESYNKRYLLINKVQGDRLRKDLVLECLIAISQNASQLGAEGIMLPTWDNLQTHTNFPEIREVLRSLVAGKQETHYVYLDNPLREALRGYVSDSGYYTQDSRNKAVHISHENLRSAKVVKSKIGLAPKFEIHNVQISVGEAALTVFEIEDVAGMTAVAKRMQQGLKLDPDTYSEIKEVFLNNEKLQVIPYIEKVVEVLKGHGFETDVKAMTSRLRAISTGFLKCPDAWSEKWHQRAFKAAASLMERQGTVSLIMDSARSDSGEKMNISELKAIRDWLYRGLDGIYVKRRAAGGLLTAFHSDYDRSMPMLFGLARESGGNDFALNEIFANAYRNSPEAFVREVVKGLIDDSRDWVQIGAVIAAMKSGVHDARVNAALDRVKNEWGVAKSDYAYKLAFLYHAPSNYRCDVLF